MKPRRSLNAVQAPGEVGDPGDYFAENQSAPTFAIYLGSSQSSGGASSAA
jgi:hypothetical protein